MSTLPITIEAIEQVITGHFKYLLQLLGFEELGQFDCFEWGGGK